MSNNQNNPRPKTEEQELAIALIESQDQVIELKRKNKLLELVLQRFIDASKHIDNFSADYIVPFCKQALENNNDER